MYDNSKDEFRKMLREYYTVETGCIVRSELVTPAYGEWLEKKITEAFSKLSFEDKKD